MDITPMEPRGIIVEQLAAAAERRARQLGLVFAPSARPLMRELIENAADQMVQQGQATDEGLRAATSIIVVLVGELGKEVRRTPRRNVDEKVFLSVISRFCPRPPIC